MKCSTLPGMTGRNQIHSKVAFFPEKSLTVASTQKREIYMRQNHCDMSEMIHHQRGVILEKKGDQAET
jgi:hypothetical protein